MSEYVIKMIDEAEPRKWTNPQNGNLVYYITVGLEGHPKPVSIGKQKPDALKVGDTVHGTIIPTDYLTDKWKGESPPSSNYSGASKSTLDYEPSTNTRWAIGMAYRAYQQVTGSPEGPDGNFPFDAVKQHASALLKMFDELKNGGSETAVNKSVVSSVSAHPEPTLKEVRASATEPSLKANWDKVTSGEDDFGEPE